MKRLTALTLALLVALGLSACQKVDTDPVPDAPVSAAPEGVETPEEAFVTLTNDALEATKVKSVSATAIITEGRVPEGEYDLPRSVVRQRELVANGGIALLAEIPEKDAAFYGLEGKEFYPALIRWGESLAEFDWQYMTPRCVEPRLWCFDYDGDGEDELAVDCYYGSGTGVSLSDLHVVEKNGDGTLTAYTFPTDVLSLALDGYLTLVYAGNSLCGVLGTELVDITGELEGERPGLEEIELGIGSTLGFERTEQGMECNIGTVLSGENMGYFHYVADITADVLYKDGKFILDGFHLDGY